MFILLNGRIDLLIYPIKARPVPIETYNHYLVSFWGGYIINTRNKRVSKGWFNKNGYRRCWLTNNGIKQKKYIHRLVGFTYVLNFNDKCEVNHDDWVRSNCNAPNLRWMTKKENLEYRYNYYSKQFDEIKLFNVELDVRPPKIGVNEDLPF